MDAPVQKFLADKFVSVWIDDKKDDQLAAKLGLSQEGYPNIAVYDGAGDYVGRVIGFPGKDAWFKEVQDKWSVGEKLATAKAAAEKDPSTWGAYATLLTEIPGREKDALAAICRLPEDKRGKEYDAAKASLLASVAWADADGALKATTKSAKNMDDLKAAAPTALPIVDAWLKDHAGKNAKLDPAAFAKKGGLLVLLDRKPEAIELATKILRDWPDSPQAQSILRGMR